MHFCAWNSWKKLTLIMTLLLFIVIHISDDVVRRIDVKNLSSIAWRPLKTLKVNRDGLHELAQKFQQAHRIAIFRLEC